MHILHINMPACFTKIQMAAARQKYCPPILRASDRNYEWGTKLVLKKKKKKI